MVQLIKIKNLSQFSELAMAGGTTSRGLLTAVIVSSLLMMINHRDLILVNYCPPIWKIALNYCVPYCPKTWTTIKGERSVMRACQT